MRSIVSYAECIVAYQALVTAYLDSKRMQPQIQWFRIYKRRLTTL